MRYVRRTIDIGHGLTKYIQFEKQDGSLLHSCFPSTVCRYDSSSDNQTGFSIEPEQLVTHNQQDYIVGLTPEQKLDCKQSVSPTSFMEYYCALARRAISLMDESSIDELYLTTPLSRLDWLKQRLTWCLGRLIKYPKSDPVLVKNVQVVPACYGGFLHYRLLARQHRQKLPDQSLVIDAGHRLIEWMPIYKNEPILKHSGFISLPLPTETLNQKDVSSKLMITRLIQRLSQVIKNSCCQSIVFTGGGAGYLAPAIRRLFPGINTQVVHDAVYANLLGYQTYFYHHYGDGIQKCFELFEKEKL